MAKPEDYQEPETVEVLFSAAEIAGQLERLSAEIVAAMGKDFLIVGLLRGSFVFIADLVRALHRHGAQPQIDFLTLSSYGARREGGSVIRIDRDIEDEVSGRSILIVDDILESGRTLEYARTMLQKRGGETAKICVLLDKPGKRKVDIAADFTGFLVPDRFVVGYGLDYAGYYRELPFIGALD